jgi:hypothetical protein
MQFEKINKRALLALISMYPAGGSHMPLCALNFHWALFFVRTRQLAL